MKLIFLDIDGTLTIPGENTPPKSALRAIKKSQEAGNKIFLCTGRNMDMLKPVLRFGFDGVVASAGGYVVCGDQVLYDCPMNAETLKEFLDVLHDHGVYCTIEAKEGTWSDENLSGLLNTQPEGNSEIERWRKALSKNLGIRPMSQYDGSPVYKIVFMCLSEDQLREAREKYEKSYDFVMQLVEAHNCFNGEIIDRRFDKGLGVEIIAKYLGVPLYDTYGFGDSMNDLPMIEKVGTGVCMGNGALPLKKLSDMVCPPIEEDGLEKAFKNLGLI